MATLTAQLPVVSGLDATYAAADVAGDEFLNTAKECIHVKNGSASPVTVTIASPNACSFSVTDTAHDRVVTIAAGDDKFIGPFPKAQFNDVDGMVQVAYSDVTTVTVAVLTIK